MQGFFRGDFPDLHPNLKVLFRFLLAYICLNYDSFIEILNPTKLLSYLILESSKEYHFTISIELSMELNQEDTSLHRHPLTDSKYNFY